MKQVVYRILSSALTAAVEDDIIMKNPCLRKDKPRHTPGELTFLNKEQALSLVEAAKGEEHYALILLALTSGMRQGELFGLLWSAVHLDGGYLMVRAQLTKDQDGNPALTAPKASRARKVDLPAITIAALRSHQKLQEPKGPWVFADINGEPLSEDRFVRNHFHPLLKKAALPHIRFHDLRHAAATLLLAAGENVKVVAERLGHSSAKMTLDVYAHALPTLQKPATAKIDEIFSNRRLDGRLKDKQTL
ncbi:MAG: tyrosine-type recombinase/integrase [Candidatus Eremiobacter antarcticus]